MKKTRKQKSSRLKISQSFFNKTLIFLFLLFLPTQLGRHFFFDFSYISGIRIDYLAPTIYITDILAILLFVFNWRRVIVCFNNTKVLFVLLLLTINMLFAPSFFLGLYRFVKIIEIVSIYAIVRHADFAKSMANWWALTAGALLELAIATIQFVRGSSIGGLFYFLGERIVSLSLPGIAKSSIDGVEMLRPYATFSHPNSMGGFYVMIYALALFAPQLKGKAVLKSLLLFAAATLVLFSFSKIAIVTLCAVSLILTIKKFPKSDCPLCVFAKIITIIGLSAVFIFAHGDPNSLVNRLMLIDNAFILIKAHLVQGVGLGNYLIAQAILPINLPYGIPQPVHNIFLLLISEVGVMISALIAAFAIFEFRRLWKLEIFRVCLFVFLATASFDHYWVTLQQNTLLLGVIGGIIVGSLKAKRQN